MKTKILSVLAVLLLSVTCQAATLEESISDFSDDISKFLHFKRETDVFVAPILGPEHLGAATPESIRNMFCGSLRKNDVNVAKHARLRISAKARHVFDSSGRVLGIAIEGILVDPFDDVLLDFTLHADAVSHQRQFVYQKTVPRKPDSDRYVPSPQKKPAVSFRTPTKRSKRRQTPTTVISLVFQEPPKR